jgi:hypothetical protein
MSQGRAEKEGEEGETELRETTRRSRKEALKTRRSAERETTPAEREKTETTTTLARATTAAPKMHQSTRRKRRVVNLPRQSKRKVQTMRTFHSAFQMT